MLSAYIKEARPKQWLKNVLVFAAPGALGALDEPDVLSRTLLVFLAYCLVSSGLYFWNDILDVAADKLHPKKSQRPIASGRINLVSARLVGTALIVGGIALSTVPRGDTAIVLGLYAALTFAYSVRLKHVVLLDLAIVASGFVLRAVAGAVATETNMSQWFVICITFGSLFIVAGKRFAELREMGSDASRTRAILAEYSEPYLRMIIGMAVTTTMVAYCLWAFESADNATGVSRFPFYELSIVPMILAVFRYVLVLEWGLGSAPEEVFARDRHIQIFAVVWVVVYGLGVYASAL
ncbi:MAG: decaprenyl-phosphate phosphoribosyltransferase [Actinobacteria bacterium]|nr:decaprenyl-phosphate phosphoribosyltransferase [Actinomycetota bacterium]